MQTTLELGAEFLKELNQRQEHTLIGKKIIEAELITNKKLEEFELNHDDIETFAENFQKIQKDINFQITQDIKNTSVKSKVLSYLSENADKIYRENLIKSKKEQIILLNNSINDQLEDTAKLAKYGSKTIDELTQITNFALSNMEGIIPSYKIKSIAKKAYEDIAKNYFEGLLSKDIDFAKEFLKSDFAKKYIKEGYLAEIQLKEQINLNKTKAEIIKNTKLFEIKKRIKSGYNVENTEILELEPFLDQKDIQILQEENNFMQKIRKMNITQLKEMRKVVDKNKIPKIDDWILNLEKNLKNDPLKTADRLGIITLSDLNFENNQSIKKEKKTSK